MRKKLFTIIIISMIATIFIFSLNKKNHYFNYLNSSDFLNFKELEDYIISNNEVKSKLKKTKSLSIFLNPKILANAYNNNDLDKKILELDKLILKINENINREYVLILRPTDNKLNFYVLRSFDKMCKISNCLYQVKAK